jgi:uncharacterized damage-inducible protein DinB
MSLHHTHRIAAALSICLVVAGFATSARAECAQCGFMADYLADFERVSGKLASLAEAIPEEKYSWSPTEEVRSVSEVVMHVVAANYLIPIGLGATPPEGMEIPENPFALGAQWEAEVTAKADVISRLEESVEYLKTAAQEVADGGLAEESELFGFPASKRAYLLIVLTHSHEHLGQQIAYARSLGVTPPWSRPSDEG